jgi:hypothetical protein
MLCSNTTFGGAPFLFGGFGSWEASKVILMSYRSMNYIIFHNIDCYMLLCISYYTILINYDELNTTMMLIMI